LGNGHPDIVVANRDSSSVSVLLGNGDGTFQPAQTYSIAPGGGAFTTAVADINGDGLPDIVVEEMTPNGSAVSVLLGNGDGTFQPQQMFAVPGGVTGSVAVADLFGNGKQDIVVTTGTGLDVLTNTSAPPDTPDGPEAPTLTAPSSLTVPARQSTQMGITASPIDSDDKLSVTISGVPLFESITAPSGDVVTRQLVHGGGKGDTYTFTVSNPTAGQGISNLTLSSSFPGKGHPVNTFTVTATNSTAGESAKSSPQTITVTDPPATTTPSYQGLALLNQFVAAGFHEQDGMPIVASSRTEINSGAETFLTQPHH
jgi:hypothetical protein